MKPKIGLFIDSKPSDGGTYQFCITLAQAFSALTPDKIEALVFYTDRLWKPKLDVRELPNVYVGHSYWTKISRRRSIAFLPMKLWRHIGPRIHPVFKMMIDSQCDLWFFPSQDTWTYLTPVKAIGVIFDLMHRYEKQFPEVSSRGVFHSRERHYKNMCRWSKGLIVDSEIGRRQVAESYKVSPYKIHVLPFVPPDYLFSNSPSRSASELPEKYIFYPAQFWQHKNHLRLVAAAEKVRKKFRDFKLVFVGSAKKGYCNVVELVNRLGLEKNIYFMGYVPDLEMPSFYRKARAMIMPTFFGPTNIPPLEAMALGCPAAVSRIYGMPEQLGDAALYFNPKNVNQMAEVLQALWEDDDLCLEMARRGLGRASKWTQQIFNEKLYAIMDFYLSTTPEKK
jgi:glycosyltransferase involved in cell wall biosynthesis